MTTDETQFARFIAFLNHCNVCDQCGDAFRDADPESLCADGEQLWNTFSDPEDTDATT